MSKTNIHYTNLGGDRGRITQAMILIMTLGLGMLATACGAEKTEQPRYRDGFAEMAARVTGQDKSGGYESVVINTSATEEQVRTAGSKTAVMPDMKDPGGNTFFKEPIFAVLISTYNGKDAYKLAQQRAREMTQKTGLNPFWVKSEEVGEVLYFGKFKSLDKAREQSAYMKGLAKAGQIQGGRIFVVQVKDKDSLGPHDLRLQKDNGYYTLQIAAFADEDRFRAARQAEAYVNKLRASGVDAFYFHSPDMSVVTAGVYPYRQVRLGSGRSGEGGKAFYSEQILEMMQKFPFNLLNGEPIRVLDQESGREKLQESLLVQIPESKRDSEANLNPNTEEERSTPTTVIDDDAGWTMP